MNTKMRQALLLLFSCGLCNSFPSTNHGKNEEEIVKIALIYPKNGGPGKSKRSSDMFPETLSFRFRVNNKEVTMNLEKNSMGNVPPVMTVVNQQPVLDTNIQIRRNFALYQGLGMGASALVRFPTDDIHNFELHASYMHGSEWYAIEPLTLSIRRKRSQVPLHTADFVSDSTTTQSPEPAVEVEHVVSKFGADATLGSFFNDIIILQDNISALPDPPMEPFPILRLGEADKAVPIVGLSGRKKRRSTRVDWSSPRTRDKRATLIKYVEYLVVLDYANYNRWQQVARGSSGDERYSNAVNSIVQYYLFITNGIDVRFHSARTLYGDLRVTLAGFIIATSADQSPWTEENKVSPGSERTYDGKSLDKFGRWINSQRGNGIPDHDHAALFTGLDLAEPDGNPATIGIAYLNRVCLSYSTSVNQETYNALSIHISAHELGHSMGANHDDGNGDCSSDKQYLMAPKLPTITDQSLVSNPYEFSPCSKTEISKYIRKLSFDCLVNVPDLLNTVTLSEKPGNVYAVDEQCYTLPDKDWVICRENYPFYESKWETICYKLECRRIGTSTCVNRRQAYDGTPCGYKKWCEKGKCVSSNESISTSELCPVGDDPTFGCRYHECSQYNRETRKGTCCSTCLETTTTVATKKTKTTSTSTTTTTPTTTTTTTPTTTTTTTPTTTPTTTATTTTPTTTTTTTTPTKTNTPSTTTRPTTTTKSTTTSKTSKIPKTKSTTSLPSMTTTKDPKQKDPLNSFELRQLISHFVALSMFV